MSGEREPDQLELPAMTAHDVDPRRAQHIRRAALRALERGGRRQVILDFYDRVLEPVLVVAIGAIYLGWALSVTRMLLAGSGSG